MAALTRLTAAGPATRDPSLYAKNVIFPGVYGQAVREFDRWVPLYGGAIVYIRKAGSNALASVFTDPEMTEPASNPQTLLSQEHEGVRYGKFLRPIYTPDAYQCDINTTDQTGVIRPALFALAGEDGDRLLVTADGGSLPRTLEAHMGQDVFVADYGLLGRSAAENTRAITAAIGQAGARGGGIVRLPPGTLDIDPISVPTGVVLTGYARIATILRSTTAASIVTLAGDGAGLADLTLDGVSVIAGSTGVLSEQQDDILIRNVDIKRFETNLHVAGGMRPRFDRLSLLNGTYGGRIKGETETLEGLWWTGGQISQHITAGLWIEYVDAPAAHLTLQEVAFRDNLTDGLILDGAQFVRLDDCVFDDNARTIRFRDVDDEAGFCSNIRVVRAEVADCQIYVDGLAIDLMMERCVFSGTEFYLAPTMGQHLVLRDCAEDAAVTTAGDGTRMVRQRSTDRGAVVGTTTSNSPVKAFAYNLEPGEVALVRARVIANGLDSEDHAAYVVEQAARRDTADLDYDSGTIAINVGDQIVGGTSGASAYVTAKSGTTAAGTLSLRAIVGTFQNNEALLVVGTPCALVNGGITDPNVSMLDSLATVFAFESDTLMACVLGASGDEVQVQVTGLPSKTVVWTAECDILRGN